MPRPDALSQRVAEARGRRTRQGEREPGAELTFRARGHVAWIGVRGEQAGAQASQSLERQRIGERVTARREQRLDRVIDGADAGRQPQLERRVQRQLGVEDDCPGQKRLTAQARFLVLGFGGEASQA